jgi:hypothetical protein
MREGKMRVWVSTAAMEKVALLRGWEMRGWERIDLCGDVCFWHGGRCVWGRVWAGISTEGCEQGKRHCGRIASNTKQKTG